MIQKWIIRFLFLKSTAHCKQSAVNVIIECVYELIF